MKNQNAAPVNIVSKFKDTELKAKKPVPTLNPKAFTGEQIVSTIDMHGLNKDEVFKNVFIPSWDNKPIDVTPILSLGGTPILTYQNTSAIIALPGVGKSSICESICSSHLSKTVDNLGFEVSEACSGVLYVDNERTNTDVWKSFNRICRRANIPYGNEISEVTVAGLRSVPRLDERLKVIENLLDDKQYGLLLIDGAGDLVTDSNDLLQAIECRIWLREITVKYKISILTTLHPNPNSNKPRGHIGSEVHRESECVLLTKKIDDDTRVITSDFEQGKNRNNANITTAFTWSENELMFISANPEDIESGKNNKRYSANKRASLELLSLKILPPPTSLQRAALEKAIKQHESCSDSTAQRRVTDMLAEGFVKKFDDGLYRLAL